MSDLIFSLNNRGGVSGSLCDTSTMLFSRVLRTDDVELIILPDLVANIHINNIVSVVKSKYWVGDVPKHEVSLDGVDCEAKLSQGDDEHKDDVLHVDMLLLERSHILTVVSTTLS